MSKYKVVSTITSVNIDAGDPVEVQWYSGDNHAAALGALVNAAVNYEDSDVPLSVRPITLAVRLEVDPAHQSDDQAPEGRRNSILVEKPEGTYYTGPLDLAKRALLDEYGDNLTTLQDPDGSRWIVAEHRHGAPMDRTSFEALLRGSNQFGIGATAEEAWRYLIGTDLGPLDDTYEAEGYEAHQRKMLGLDASVETQIFDQSGFTK